MQEQHKDISHEEKSIEISFYTELLKAISTLLLRHLIPEVMLLNKLGSKLSYEEEGAYTGAIGVTVMLLIAKAVLPALADNDQLAGGLVANLELGINLGDIIAAEEAAALNNPWLPPVGDIPPQYWGG